MISLRKSILAALVLTWLTLPAMAESWFTPGGAGTLTVVPMGGCPTAGGDCAGPAGSAAAPTVVQGATGGVPVPVSGNVGGYDSGTAPVQTATPNSSSHAAGTSVGGLFSIPIARTAGGSGEVENFIWISTGGDATGKQVRLYDKNPTNTVCTDQTAFSSTGSDYQHLISIPFVFTPAAPTNTTGDAKTYGSYQFVPPLSFANQDSAATKNIYACVVTTATDTLDESAAVYINLTGPQN